jgi:protein-tyrosine phosphatase
VLYARHVALPWRWLLHGWFALIGISILTTWQHHFFDLPTGIWVGWLSVWLFPDEGEPLLAKARLSTEPQRRALALRYGVAAVLAGAIALGVGGWTWWLLWAAGALALVAAIYLLLDEEAFQKRANGSMRPASWWLLAPYFAGAWLNSRWWTRQAAAADAIVPGLLLGRLPRRAEREALGVAATVDLTAELPFASAGTCYANVAQLDLAVPTPEQLARSVQAIDHARVRGPVLVCCALGFSRSAAAAAAWLLASGHARDVPQAIGLVRGARRGVVLGPAYVQALERYSRKLPERQA